MPNEKNTVNNSSQVSTWSHWDSQVEKFQSYMKKLLLTYSKIIQTKNNALEQWYFKNIRLLGPFPSCWAPCLVLIGRLLPRLTAPCFVLSCLAAGLGGLLLCEEKQRGEHLRERRGGGWAGRNRGRRNCGWAILYERQSNFFNKKNDFLKSIKRFYVGSS